jgi:hypothetical protein
MNIGAFFSGGLDPYWPHVLLIGSSVLASAAVTWGLVSESKPFLKLANLLIVGGVVAEAICTILLFGFDEGISNAQLSKIATLETRIAQRELTPDQTKGLRAALAAVPTPVQRRVVFAYLLGDQEAGYFTYEVARYFLADWKVDVEVDAYPQMILWGVRVWGPENRTTQAIKDILSAAQIPFATRPPNGHPMQSFGHVTQPDETVVFIGPKPPAITDEEAVRAGLQKRN